MKRFIVSLAAFAVTLGLAGAAQAATATSTIPVSVTIKPACSVTSTAIGFLPYPNALATGKNANGAVSVTCAIGTAWSVTIDGGLNWSGATRRVGLSGNYVDYGVYTDATYSVQYAPGTGFSGTGNGGTQTTTVYGQLQPGVTLPPPGLYTDTITVTITY